MQSSNNNNSSFNKNVRNTIEELPSKDNKT